MTINRKRDSLKRLAGVGAIVSLWPKEWVKPITNSVLLPTHAQTSVLDADFSLSYPLSNFSSSCGPPIDIPNANVPFFNGDFNGGPSIDTFYIDDSVFPPRTVTLGGEVNAPGQAVVIQIHRFLHVPQDLSLAINGFQNPSPPLNGTNFGFLLFGCIAAEVEEEPANRNFEFSFSSVVGAVWLADASYSITADGFDLGDLILRPASGQV